MRPHRQAIRQRGVRAATCVAAGRPVLIGIAISVLVSVPGLGAQEQRPPPADRATDTLVVLLLSSIDSLKSELAASRGRTGELEEEVTRLEERFDSSRAESEIVRAWVERALADADTARAAAAERARSDVERARAEGSRERAVLIEQADSMGQALAALDGRVGDWQTRMSDSLQAATDRAAQEQTQRQAGDRGNQLFAAAVGGLLIICLGLVVWRARRQAAALDGRISDGAAATADQLKEIRRGASAAVSPEVLVPHVSALEKLTETLSAVADQPGAAGAAQPDHDLPLGICNEVNRIEKNLQAMDSKVRGHKQLRGCVRRVKDNLRVHDYEITELLGRRYDSGMELDADFVPDEALAPGEKLITRINRPEVRHAGAIIQNASVKVSMRP